jgi:hypothetical protein
MMKKITSFQMFLPSGLELMQPKSTTDSLDAPWILVNWVVSPL